MRTPLHHRQSLPALAAVLCICSVLTADEPAPTANAAFPVSIEVDAAHTLGEMKPVWRFFGADEPNYATMPDGQKLLADIGRLRPHDTYFRAHNLLTSGDGTPALKWGSTNIYTEDAKGNPVYDWTTVDAIFDSYIARGVHPYVELGFMPEALSIHPQPYRHHWHPGLAYRDIITGWAYPPKDYDKWRELIYQWAKHCLARYGAEEVGHWYWEVWNEPNGSYWKATPAEYRKLYDYAVDGVRRALPTARVGGAHTAGPGGAFQHDFLAHCLHGTDNATGANGSPLDFVAFHAKGSPSFVNGHVRLGIANQLRAIDQGLALVNSFPELKGKPVIIGESDPDGCAACQGPQLGYRNTTMYSSYTAASFAREYELADRRHANLEGAVTWAFEFEDQPWFAGFRVLATHGVTLPVFNVFRMFSLMGGQRVAVTSDAAVPLDRIMKDGVRQKPDVSALAALETHKLSVLAWHYHDDDVPGPDALVTLDITSLPASNGTLRIRQYLIDENHSNAFTAWKSLGSPAAPTPAQYATLAAAGQLAEVPAPVPVRDAAGRARLLLTLPRQAVGLLILEWK